MSVNDFPVSEFEQRTMRAQALMRHDGFDALFLMTEPEVRYFTGFRSQFWLSPTRPWFVIVPADGKPIAIIPEIGGALMKRQWIEDVRLWSSPHQDDDGVSMLIDALSGFQTIGILKGRESNLRMPLGDYERLRERTRHAQFCDASQLIADLRFVKSEAEIDLHRDICSVASRAFDQVPHLACVGQPLDELFRAFKVELLNQGAEDVPYLVGGAGQSGYDDVISPPDNTPLREGDVLMLDTGSTLKGYFCDFDRNFSIGQPSDGVKKAHETLWLATEAAIDAARPGVTCAELFRVMHSVIDDSQSNVGRYGHGLGMQLTETPSIIGWDKTVLKEGAVITLEPSITVAGGGMLVHEENIVIRDGIPELLSKRAPREMPVIA